MRQELLKLPVTQSDETPTQVIHDDRAAGSKSYMWVHRSGGFFKEKPIVIYEYQKGRNYELPLAFYQDYKGILITDSLEQYHLIEKKIPGLTNANCWAHARRDYADAIKAADKSDPDAVRRSAVYQALNRISQIYKLEGALKNLPPEEGTVPPKSKTADGLRYSVNQEELDVP